MPETSHILGEDIIFQLETVGLISQDLLTVYLESLQVKRRMELLAYSYTSRMCNYTPHLLLDYINIITTDELKHPINLSTRISHFKAFYHEHQDDILKL